MPRRTNNVKHPDRPGEQFLRRAQRSVIAGQRALIDRDTMLAAMFDRGYEQPELLSLLNDECDRAGVPQLTADAVQKAIRKVREAKAAADPRPGRVTTSP